MQRATRKGNVPCALHQEFLFFGSRVFGFRSGPSWLTYWLLRDQLYEEAMCKGSTGNGLLNTAKAVPEKDYFTHIEAPAAKHLQQGRSALLLEAKHNKAVIRQATNAIYGMGTLKIPLRSIRSEEGPHYRLGEKREEAVIRQATMIPIHKFGYPLVIPYPGCTAQLG